MYRRRNFLARSGAPASWLAKLGIYLATLETALAVAQKTM